MRSAIGVLLAFAPSLAAASQTLCTFEPPAGAPVPALEFLGYDAIGPVLIHDRSGPRRLPHGSWQVLAFDRRGATIDLRYANPGDPSLPPGFTLQGRGRQARLTAGGRAYTGELRCDD